MNKKNPAINVILDTDNHLHIELRNMPSPNSRVSFNVEKPEHRSLPLLDRAALILERCASLSKTVIWPTAEKMAYKMKYGPRNEAGNREFTLPLLPAN